MGAAGNVAAYDRDAVVAKHREMHGADVREDWWYMDTTTITLDGKAWILDYGDDQGMHEGTGNDFWFKDREAQARVRATLHAVGWAGGCEVWT